MVATSPRGRVQRVGHAAVDTVRWTAGAVAAVVLVVGCAITAADAGAAGAGAGADAGAAGAGAGAHAGVGPGSPAAFYRTPGPLPQEPPGAIVRSVVIPSAGLLPGGATAYRVLYHSQSIAGADIAVSGVVVVPGGTPPPGGFPIVAWAHGTTGLSDQCAPSLGGFASIPSLTAFLDRGMIVAATDYEGLGTPGIHPYLVGQSEAQSVLDSARAARNLAGVTASNQVAVVGYSQGGQAALF
ncbi:MAG TPA: lipase family protein, partial [Acidimicrobiales bacterium]